MVEEFSPAKGASADASAALYEDAKQVNPNLFVVCDNNTCTPFSTKASGPDDPVKFLQDNFGGFDKADGKPDDFITIPELQDVGKHFKTGTAPRTMTDKLIKHADKIDDQHKDEKSWNENDGITMADLEAVAKMQKMDRAQLTEEQRALVDALSPKKNEEPKIKR